jgi:hypothetical protein
LISAVPGKNNSIVTLAVVEEGVLLICNNTSIVTLAVVEEDVLLICNNTWAGPHDLDFNNENR